MRHERATIQTQRHVRAGKNHGIELRTPKRQRVGRGRKRARAAFKSRQFHTELHERQPQAAAAKEIRRKTDKHELGCDRTKLLPARVALAQKQRKTKIAGRAAGQKKGIGRNHVQA